MEDSSEIKDLSNAMCGQIASYYSLAVQHSGLKWHLAGNRYLCTQ